MTTIPFNAMLTYTEVKSRWTQTSDAVVMRLWTQLLTAHISCFDKYATKNDLRRNFHRVFICLLNIRDM